MPEKKQCDSFLLPVLLSLCGALAICVTLWQVRSSKSRSITTPTTPKTETALKQGEDAQGLDRYPRWGGAVNSAHESGEGFFDQSAARTFQEDVQMDEKYVVDLNARSFMPLASAKAEESFQGDGVQVVYLQFFGHPSEVERAELGAAGVALLGYIDGYAWRARGTPQALTAIRSTSIVRGMARVDSRDKLSAALFRGQTPAHARTEEGHVRYVALCDPDTQKTDWLSSARASGVKVWPSTPSALGPRYALEGDRSAALAVASLTQTHYLRYAEPPAASRDAEQDAASNVNDVRDSTPNLDGAGVKVAVREVDQVVVHADFSARHTDGDALGAPVDPDHATGVMGIIGGDGTVVPQAKGVAPKCTLFSYDLVQEGNTPFTVTDINDAFSLKAARISNHSYGPTGVGDGSYSDISADWDQAIKASDLLALLSSNEVGNENLTAGDFKQIDFFVGCKNGICVSSAPTTAHAGDADPLTPRADGISNFVDFGPMADGRVKPDLVAVGEDIITLKDSNLSNTGQRGTSYSCPAVTGMLALLFQRYNTQFSSEPPAALAKGLMLNCATDLGEVGPDAKYGYGIANIERVIEIIDRHNLVSEVDKRLWHYEGAGLGEGGSITYSLTIGAESEVKVMLVWMDPAGSPTAAGALVNNLDLSMTRSLTTYYPYSLDKASPAAAATNTGPNNVDCVEQIILTNPEPGAYSINVKGTSVPDGIANPQPFAIVVSLSSDFGASITPLPLGSGVVSAGTAYLPVGGGQVKYAVTFSGGTPPYNLAWDYLGNGTIVMESATANTFESQSFTYPAGAKPYIPKVNITDSSPQPKFTEAFSAVEVLNPPTAILTASPTTGEVPLEVNLTALQSTGKIKSFTWNVADGSATQTTDSSIQSIQHTYRKEGTYTATLAVTDIVGQTSNTDTQTIVVNGRVVPAFAHRLRATLQFPPSASSNETGRANQQPAARLMLTIVVAELAFPRGEAKQLIQDGTFENKTYNVLIGPEGSQLELGPFLLDARGRAQADPREFRLIFSRKGYMLVNVASIDILNVFDALGMNSSAASANSVKLDPNTYYSFPVTVIDDAGVVYPTEFKVAWTKLKNGKASAREGVLRQ